MLLSKDLPPLKTAAKQQIDDSAEQIRGLFITPGSGQAMAYQEKYNEAVYYLTTYAVDPATIDPNLVPAILGEVGITAPTAYEVAQTVANLQAMWKQISAGIEQIRLAAKAAVDAATNPAEITSAATLDWSPITAQIP